MEVQDIVEDEVMSTDESDLEIEDQMLRKLMTTLHRIVGTSRVKGVQWDILTTSSGSAFLTLTLELKEL